MRIHKLTRFILASGEETLADPASLDGYIPHLHPVINTLVLVHPSRTYNGEQVVTVGQLLNHTPESLKIYLAVMRFLYPDFEFTTPPICTNIKSYEPINPQNCKDVIYAGKLMLTPLKPFTSEQKKYRHQGSWIVVDSEETALQIVKWNTRPCYSQLDSKEEREYISKFYKGRITADELANLPITHKRKLHCNCYHGCTCYDNTARPKFCNCICVCSQHCPCCKEEISSNDDGYAIIGTTIPFLTSVIDAYIWMRDGGHKFLVNINDPDDSNWIPAVTAILQRNTLLPKIRVYDDCDGIDRKLYKDFALTPDRRIIYPSDPEVVRSILRIYEPKGRFPIPLSMVLKKGETRPGVLARANAPQVSEDSRWKLCTEVQPDVRYWTRTVRLILNFARSISIKEGYHKSYNQLVKHIGTNIFATFFPEIRDVYNTIIGLGVDKLPPNAVFLEDKGVVSGPLAGFIVECMGMGAWEWFNDPIYTR